MKMLIWAATALAAAMTPAKAQDFSSAELQKRVVERRMRHAARKYVFHVVSIKNEWKQIIAP